MAVNAISGDKLDLKNIAIHPWYHLTTVAHTQNNIFMSRNMGFLDLVGGHKIDSFQFVVSSGVMPNGSMTKFKGTVVWVTFHSYVPWKVFTLPEM